MKFTQRHFDLHTAAPHTVTHISETTGPNLSCMRSFFECLGSEWVFPPPKVTLTNVFWMENGFRKGKKGETFEFGLGRPL